MTTAWAESYSKWMQRVDYKSNYSVNKHTEVCIRAMRIYYGITEHFISVVGYEGLYEVSNFGRIKSAKRDIFNGWNTYVRDEKMLSLNCCDRYMRASLWKNNIDKKVDAHRLVQYHFDENPLCKPQINHIDGNPTNNYVENLEWVTPAENIRHSFNELNRKATWEGIFGNSHPKSKTVIQMNKDYSFVAEFESTTEASNKTGVNRGHIADVCRGERKYSGGYIWKYK